MKILNTNEINSISIIKTIFKSINIFLLTFFPLKNENCLLLECGSKQLVELPGFFNRRIAAV